jgi:hypothetical protein
MRQEPERVAEGWTGMSEDGYVYPLEEPVVSAEIVPIPSWIWRDGLDVVRSEMAKCGYYLRLRRRRLPRPGYRCVAVPGIGPPA